MVVAGGKGTSTFKYLEGSTKLFDQWVGKYKSNTDTRARGSGKCVKVSLHDRHSVTVVILIYE